MSNLGSLSLPYLSTHLPLSIGCAHYCHLWSDISSFGSTYPALTTLRTLSELILLIRNLQMSADMTALLNGPAGTPPAGTVPQLNDPQNQRAATNVLPTLSIVLMTVLVAIRMYTTVFITRRVGIADCESPISINLFRPLA